VHGAVLSYGDPLAPPDNHRYEPMSGWRRSKPQEKKLGRSPVYMPREHDPARAAWRSLAALLMSEGGEPAPPGEPAPYLRAGVLQWIAELTEYQVLPEHMLIRPRLIGAAYGTQQSVVDEVVDDGLTMAVVLLHEHGRLYGKQALGAVEDSNTGVAALGDLAADLARAAGREPEALRDTARDLGFGLLDGPYRQWLADLGDAHDLTEARRSWQQTAYRILRDVADAQLATAAGPGWIDNAAAERIFLRRLDKAFSLRHEPEADARPDPEAANTSKGASP
jgi:CRISPR system Cascade subunit CasA